MFGVVFSLFRADSDYTAYMYHCNVDRNVVNKVLLRCRVADKWHSVCETKYLIISFYLFYMALCWSDLVSFIAFISQRKKSSYSNVPTTKV